MSYSPTIGRWMEQDPIGYDDGMNPYQYERSNPLNRLDPNGTDSGFWEFLKAYDACLNNNNPLDALGRYILDSLAGANALRIPIPVSKSLLEQFAREVLNDADLARKIAANAAREGADQFGSLQKFVRQAIRSGKGKEAADFFSKTAKGAGAVTAVLAVVDAAIHTHCAAMACSLASSGNRYNPSQDHFIDDWIRYWFNK